MNHSTTYIAKFAKVSIDEALKIQETIDNEYLVDWSEDTATRINNKIKLAMALMANGGWENLDVPMACVL